MIIKMARGTRYMYIVCAAVYLRCLPLKTMRTRFLCLATVLGIGLSYNMYRLVMYFPIRPIGMVFNNR